MTTKKKTPKLSPELEQRLAEIVPDSFMQRLRSLYHKLYSVTATEDWCNDIPADELYLFVAAILEFSDGFCMDNQEEREALTDVMATELQRFFSIRRKRR